MIVYGINPVLEALRAGSVVSIRVASASAKTAEIRDVAKRVGMSVVQVPRALLDRATGGAHHQDVVAEVEEPKSLSLSELIDGLRNPALLMVLDGIEDPQNFGAILRSAEAAAVDGVIRQTRRSAPVGRVARASAGAFSHVRVVSVVNVARAITLLQASGVWVVGLATGGDDLYGDVDLTLPTALVLGSEARGLRRLVRERCDRVVSIPMLGRMNSLNVSGAAGISLFEAVRQRRI